MLFTFVYAMVRKSDVCLEILSKDLIKIPVDYFLIYQKYNVRWNQVFLIYLF